MYIVYTFFRLKQFTVELELLISIHDKENIVEFQIPNRKEFRSGISEDFFNIVTTYTTGSRFS